jgi:hypothetical protein
MLATLALPTKIALLIPDVTYKVGQFIPMDAYLTTQDNVPIIGKTMHFYVRPVGRPWVYLGSAPTNALGEGKAGFVDSRNVAGLYEYMAYFEADGTYEASVSTLQQISITEGGGEPASIIPAVIVVGIIIFGIVFLSRK